MRLIILLIIAIVLLHLVKCGKSSMDVKLSNDNKPWNLKMYKVNGVDSTEAVNAGRFQNFTTTFLVAPKESRNSGTPFFYNGFYEFAGSIEDNNKIFRIKRIDVHKTPEYMHKDTCFSLNIQDCQRNVFMPEGIETAWKIERLRIHSFILSCRQKNEYYIEMTD